MGEVPAQSVHSVDVAQELHILSAGESSAPGMPLGVSTPLFRVVTILDSTAAHGQPLLVTLPPPWMTTGSKPWRARRSRKNYRLAGKLAEQIGKIQKLNKSAEQISEIGRRFGGGGGVAESPTLDSGCTTDPRRDSEMNTQTHTQNHVNSWS